MSRYGEAVLRLSAAQKPGKGVSLYSRYINRPAGRRLAAAGHVIGLAPNQVTMISALFSFTGVVLIATVAPSHPLAIAVYAALAIGFALDSADGQLARLTGTGSPAGEWLDHMVDCAKMLALHTAVLITFHRHFDFSGSRYLLIPLAFQFAAVLIFFGGILTEQLKRGRQRSAETAAPAAPASPAAPVSALRSLALLPVDYGVLCAVFLFLGNRTLFLALYGSLLAVHLLFLAAFLVKWYRELSVPAR